MSRRRLSDDERSLWSGVTRSIKPLRQRARAPADGPPDFEPARARSPAAGSRPVPASPRTAPRSPAPTPPPLAPLGRRFKQEVGRGRRPIDARLDLHGMTQAQAHGALLGFLRGAQARGARTVLVITGKGAAAPDFASERGTLRRQVPQWLRLPEFRLFVVGFEPASPAHGGEGALYVSLRRARMPQD
jgi:DNA-nicking Smr family endonuclease